MSFTFTPATNMVSPAVAFDTDAQVYGPTSAVVSGTISDNSGPAFIEIYDGARDLGAASIGPKGAWTFDAHLSPGTHQLTAVATDLSGQVSRAQTPYVLNTGIVNRSFAAQEIKFDASGNEMSVENYAADGTAVSQSVTNGDGSHAITGLQPGEILASLGNDVLTGGGAGTRFTFTAPLGFDEVTDFTAAGAGHDYLYLPSAQLPSFAAVMHHTTTALDGSAVIHLDPRDAIKLDGVSKATLMVNRQDLFFHP